MKIIQKVLFSISLPAVSFLVSFLAFVSPVQAETHITDDMVSDASAIVWTKDASPYVMDDDVDIRSGTTITIGPGVTITTSSSSPGSFSVGGILVANGTAAEPITIENLSSFNLWNSPVATSTITHAVINVPTGLALFKINLAISSSTITGANNGIYTRGSTLVISDSDISGNKYGIYSQSMPVFQVFNSFVPFNFFRVPKAYAQTTVDSPNENHITISSSSITNNALFGIFNATVNVVNAKNNWWGSAAGPGAAVSSGVDYAPWFKDPTGNSTSTPAVCCSNVLFLPGIEASRLYQDQKSIISHGTSTNELWEPNRNDDVRKLFMTTNGQSVGQGIYTKDVIDAAMGLGMFPIYKGFIAMMNGVVADKTINSWQAYPYDWRFDVGTVVSQKLVDTILSLASTSKTGKVTVVAHSNGGLVVKELAKTLADKGQSSLLDKVILVAVPQLGTPEAISGLLHGDDQSILGGLLLTQSVARQLGDNMPGGYGLLPSRNYFSELALPTAFPIVSFASSTLSDFNLLADGQSIWGYDALRKFLSGIADHRAAPADSDIASPAVLHSAMIDSSQKIHNTIDGFSFASTTKPIILAGWGKPTVAGLSYYEINSCSAAGFRANLGIKLPCTKLLEHSATTTLFGDDTVVLESAAAPILHASSYYLDLGSANKGKDGHATILSTDSGIAFVKEQVTDNETLPPYISQNPPTMADAHENDLIVSVHSPVELNMYDSEGNHTGPIPNPDPTSDLGRFEENIPYSQYVPNDGDTYIRVPYGTDYRVTFTGTGMGSFEVDTEHNVNDAIVAKTVFADMPVTPLLKAELILSTTSPASFDSSSDASSTPTTTQMIVFDFDGNGTVDATTTPHDEYDPVLDMQSYQTIVSSMNLSPAKEKAMHDKIGLIIDCLKKKKPLKEVKKPNTQALNSANQAMKDLQNQHWNFKNLDSAHKQKIEDIFQAFIDDIDIQ